MHASTLAQQLGSGRFLSVIRDHPYLVLQSSHPLCALSFRVIPTHSLTSWITWKPMEGTYSH